MKKYIFKLFCLGFFTATNAQNTPYWQQQADYKMEIEMDAKNFRYSGKQQLTYTNNSPDTLHVVFYHLFLNAFQPGSEMDARLQTIPDPDRRMVINKGTPEKPVYQSRIALLKPNEIGYINVKSLTQNGKPIQHKTEGTILKAELNSLFCPIQKPFSKWNLTHKFP